MHSPAASFPATTTFRAPRRRAGSPSSTPPSAGPPRAAPHETDEQRRALADAGIDLEDVTAQLLREGIDAFMDKRKPVWKDR